MGEMGYDINLKYWQVPAKNSPESLSKMEILKMAIQLLSVQR